MTESQDNKQETLQAQEKIIAPEIPEKKVEQEQETKEDNENPNWKAFREARKKDRAEKEEANRRAAEKAAEAAALKAALEATFARSAPTPQAYQSYYGQEQEQEESEDQRIEKKINALLAAKEEQARKAWEEKERAEYPQRLAKDFPDFHKVIAQENLDYLDFHFPEVSSPLQRLQDGYEKWADIYRAVKKFVPNTAEAKKDAEKANANALKPKSISSTTLTQTGENIRPSWQEQEARRAENWARMQRVMKGIS